MRLWMPAHRAAAPHAASQAARRLRPHGADTKCAAAARPAAAAAAAAPDAAAALVLRGTNVYVVGDSSEGNWRLAQALAARLRYAPLRTEALLEGAAGRAADAVEREEGAAAVALAEAVLLESLCTYARVCVATLGGVRGAAARGDCWRHLFGGVTVWLDVPGCDAGPQRSAYELAEIRVAVGEGAAGVDAGDAAVVERVLGAVGSMDPQLVGKKSLYVRLGARGDWPDLAPPGPIGDIGAGVPEAQQ